MDIMCLDIHIPVAQKHFASRLTKLKSVAKSECFSFYVDIFLQMSSHPRYATAFMLSLRHKHDSAFSCDLWKVHLTLRYGSQISPDNHLSPWKICCWVCIRRYYATLLKCIKLLTHPLLLHAIILPLRQIHKNQEAGGDPSTVCDNFSRVE